MATPLPQDFREFLKLCNDHRLEYLLVGGYAVCAHGYVRPTGDLDIWIAIGPANAAKAVETLRAFGFGSAHPTPDLLMQRGRIVRMGVQPVRIEILNDLSGVDFAACVASAVVVDFDGLKVPVISRRDLITNKKAAGRFKDLNDVQQLTAPDAPT